MEELATVLQWKPDVPLRYNLPSPRKWARLAGAYTNPGCLTVLAGRFFPLECMEVAEHD